MRERNVDDVYRVTSQVIPMCDGSPETKVPIQIKKSTKANSQSQSTRVEGCSRLRVSSRLGTKASRLIRVSKELGFSTGKDRFSAQNRPSVDWGQWPVDRKQAVGSRFSTGRLVGEPVDRLLKDVHVCARRSTAPLGPVDRSSEKCCCWSKNQIFVGLCVMAKNMILMTCVHQI